MKPNISPVDCMVRSIVGLAVLGTGYYMHSWWGLAGLPVLLTAAVRYCPTYGAFRIDDSAGSKRKF